jgi:cytochrome P450
MPCTQVIKESQRLFPAAAIGPLRYAAANAELAGYFIPKGTHIQVAAAVLFFLLLFMQHLTEL